MKVIKTFDTLYSKTASGKINVWSICVKNDDNIAYICTYSGLEGGKITEYIKKVHKGKNIGKKNETTAIEQAISEAQSTWTKRIDKNNCKLSKDDLLTNLDIVPMSAQYFDSRSKYIDYATYRLYDFIYIYTCIERERSMEDADNASALAPHPTAHPA